MIYIQHNTKYYYALAFVLKNILISLNSPSFYKFRWHHNFVLILVVLLNKDEVHLHFLKFNLCVSIVDPSMWS